MVCYIFTRLHIKHTPITGNCLYSIKITFGDIYIIYNLRHAKGIYLIKWNLKLSSSDNVILLGHKIERDWLQMRTNARFSLLFIWFVTNDGIFINLAKMKMICSRCMVFQEFKAWFTIPSKYDFNTTNIVIVS